MLKCRQFIIVFALFILPDIIIAQQQSHSIKLYFAQGDTKIDASYRTNAVELRKLDSLISLTKRDSILTIEKLEFRAGVSPEGGTEVNKRIVMERLNVIYQMVKREILFPDSVIDMRPNHTDWSLLRELVAKSDMQYRAEVLDILNNIPEHRFDKNGKWVDGRRKHLMALRGGKPYSYMLDNFFPMMRYAESRLTLSFRTPTSEEKKQMEQVEEILKDEPIADIVEDTIPAEWSFIPVMKERTPFYVALSSNMLYYAALIPNIGLEFYLGEQWSLQGDWHYGWWKSDRVHNYWRFYGGGLEVRKWLGGRAKQKPLQGHHIGVYGLIATYDFELGGRGYLGDKWSWSAGIGYGYSLPIAKRINFDFGVNVGYFGGEYKEYLPIDDHYVWQVTKNRHYFGITKAYVSFVWLLGNGNYNKRRK